MLIVELVVFGKVLVVGQVLGNDRWRGMKKRTPSQQSAEREFINLMNLDYCRTNRMAPFNPSLSVMCRR